METAGSAVRGRGSAALRLSRGLRPMEKQMRRQPSVSKLPGGCLRICFSALLIAFADIIPLTGITFKIIIYLVYTLCLYPGFYLCLLFFWQIDYLYLCL